MKNMFMLIAVSLLLVTLGFGQTPASTGNNDQASVKGCLGGSEGNYTLAEDGTTQVFTITSSTVDLKPHVGHDVELVGQKTTVPASSGSSANKVAVTGLNMISDHCATPTNASAPAAADTTPTTPASSPAANTTTTTPSASAPPPADTTPTSTASTPAVSGTTSNATTTASAATQNLPETATPLPLLGLLGLGLMATGLVSKRSRQK
jgi:hypothetical protein